MFDSKTASKEEKIRGYILSLKAVRKVNINVSKDTYIELMGGPFDGLIVSGPVAVMEFFQVPVNHPIRINEKPQRGPLAGYAIYGFNGMNFDKKKPRALYNFLRKESV